MSWMIRQNKNPINPALAELIKLLAQAAVEDYLQELAQTQGEMEDGNQKN